MNIVSESAMKALGQSIGRRLRGGECIELVGDVGVGKTTLVKGIADGLAIDEDVQSPSFTLSREYDARDNLVLAHYDFYRLHEAGVLGYELAESLADSQTVTVIEWAETIGAVLPDDRITVTISYSPTDETRRVAIQIAPSLSYMEIPA